MLASPAGQWMNSSTRPCSAIWPMPALSSNPGRQIITRNAPIRHLATRRPMRLPSACSPQPAAALRHLKAPRSCRLLHLRRSAYQPKGLRFRVDESSVAGQQQIPRASDLATMEWVSSQKPRRDLPLVLQIVRLSCDGGAAARHVIYDGQRRGSDRSPLGRCGPSMSMVAPVFSFDLNGYMGFGPA